MRILGIFGRGESDWFYALSLPFRHVRHITRGKETDGLKTGRGPSFQATGRPDCQEDSGKRGQ